MAKLTCSQIVDSTIAHLNGQFLIQPLDDGCLVITPFMDAERAPVELFVREVDNEFLLTDEGNITNQLFLNGLTVEENPELIQGIVTIAHTNEVDFRDSELFVRASRENIGEALQNLASAIQAVSFLQYKKSHRLRVSFDEEVERLLISNNIKYEYKYSLRGLANTHTVPFYMNSSRNVLLEPIFADSVSSARNKAKKVAYEWGDIQRQHGGLYKYLVILDDQKTRQREVWHDPEAMSALQNYSTDVLFWTEDQSKLIALLQE